MLNRTSSTTIISLSHPEIIQNHPLTINHPPLTINITSSIWWMVNDPLTLTININHPPLTINHHPPFGHGISQWPSHALGAGRSAGSALELVAFKATAR
jgi:hypothetical protein